jgi:hypothetical protein
MTFVIQNTSDPSKQINFSAAGISPSTTRTITMPDFNVNLGALTNNNISASAAIAYSKLNLASSIVNADIAAAAAIDFSKLATLASGNILVGSAGGVATSVAMSGEATIANTGA